MLFFTNAKINIGLNIVEKRPDGFHNLETVFYPIQIKDALEFIETQGETIVQTSGIELGVSDKENICYKTYKLMAKYYKLPQLKIHLHKVVPIGAGLGGGSANAAILMKKLNDTYNLGISTKRLEELVSHIGSDCPFFIKNKAVFARGRGEIFESINLDLSNYYIYIIKPDISISTSAAFAGIKPHQPNVSIKELISKPIEQWKNDIVNDFEDNIFKQYPMLGEIKQNMYDIGAVYASMSGSGSAVYGIFSQKPNPIDRYNNIFNWIGKL